MPAAEYLELLAEKQLELLNVTSVLDYLELVVAMWDLDWSRTVVNAATVRAKGRLHRLHPPVDWGWIGGPTHSRPSKTSMSHGMVFTA
ncbi:hypothetical protein [Saccharothrix xinjiangensis]|uniref:Uncharacterized protein n=1 Tax=Saccharothrix xinjiangensis TaxID=204798 RepID=A0ABV9Y7J5_9PSEU